ncbi:MAG: type II toxin-antitoxin system VapC family toxin [Propionibacteriaceae bacterium]|nr:type II toxin-antitoxin system VapC family toxin [Propionibacteriaceae bacterium]
MRWYLDTSAALKLLLEEEETTAMVAAVEEGEAELAGSVLLETELRRAAWRHEALQQSAVTALLEGIALFDMPASLFTQAGLLGGANLRSLDALHLASAIRCAATHIVTYDKRMVDAAQALGLPVLSPG